MRYEVRHSTSYDYECPVLHGRHIVHQRLRATASQIVERSELAVTPGPSWQHRDVDYFGNEIDAIEIIEQHEQLTVETRSVVNVRPVQTDFALAPFQHSWDRARDRLNTDPNCVEAREFRHDSPLVRRHRTLSAFAADSFTAGRPLYEAVVDLNARIYGEFQYDPTSTIVSTPLAQVLRERRGVCQDFAHVAVGVLRSLGLAARYVSGYLETNPPDGKPRLVGADASHAWSSVYIPEWGWLDFDPTNNVLPGERHVVVAWGRDFSDVSPFKGVVHGGGRHTVGVGVDVVPLVAA